MPISDMLMKDYLRTNRLKDLFVECLGWNHYHLPLAVAVGGQNYVLTPIAERNGIAALQCSHRESGAIPDYPTRRKIEREVKKHVAEHVIVYVDSTGHRQLWQWVRREPGKPAACREHSIDTRYQSGDLLVQKLRHAAFDFSEEDTLTLVEASDRVRKAFDVEKVTKKFFEQFKKQHAEFLKQILGIDSIEDRAWYASVMLNRLMFVYFIQAKRFLDDDPLYLRHKLTIIRNEHGDDRFHSFYRLFLLRLFHEGLGEKPSARTDVQQEALIKLLGNVPYLNGGIFEKHDLELKYQEITIPDAAFEAIFDFFDGYSWHLDDRPLRSDKEINPDVLGYIFEKYINNKEMGAFYTREDITEYIGRNTILPYLADAASEKYPAPFKPGGIWRIAQADPMRYIFPAMRFGCDTPLPVEIATGIDDVSMRGGWNRPATEPYALPTETWRETVARRRRCEVLVEKLSAGDVQSINDFITLNLDIRQFVQDVIENCDDPELLYALWKSIESVRVLDPTVGSGAFLFAALNILEPLYEACLERMEAFVNDTETATTWAGEFAFVNDVTAQQAFIDESAAKYSLEFRRVLDGIEDHRERRYHVFKSIIVNNLFGVDIMAEATEICKLRLFLKLVAQVERVEDLEPLPDIDFNVVSGNSLVGYVDHNDRSRLWTLAGFDDDPVPNLDIMVQAYSDKLTDFNLRQLGLPSSFQDTKVEVARAANLVKGPINADLLRLYKITGAVQQRLTREQFEQTHHPFHWFLQFPGPMGAGGFDVIIGNPPYVEYKQVAGQYSLPLGYASMESGNLYAFCMERSILLAAKNGRFGMIVPTSVVGLDANAKLRRELCSSFGGAWISTYAIRPSKLFYGVDQRLCIYLAGHNAGSELYTSKFNHWNSDEREALFQVLELNHTYHHRRLDRIPQIGNATAASILNKVEANSGGSLGLLITKRKSGFLLHYHRSPRYWIRSLDFEPHFLAGAKTRSTSHFRDIWFRDALSGKAVGALLNSNLFFWWFISVGNGRNITEDDVYLFPFQNARDDLLVKLVSLFDTLMVDYQANSTIRVLANCEYQEFDQARSKPLIDEIDRVLAQHYGFSDEELDFLINYDIKYRMGKGADDEGT